MRLIELFLDAYGPFCGVKLDFDRAAQLHIVYGPNEAGKTSALAAIGDLFYGVPPRAEKTFLRPADLRLGASVEARNGQMLQFFRRRGVKAALTDASGAALPDDCLAPFLGAASRSIFDRVFGLDAEALRKGGEDMLRAEGEIGASLFAAASGLRGLLDLRGGLEQEAEKVFDERKAAHRTFYQALDRFNEARRAEKDATLSEHALKNLRRKIGEAGEQLEALRAQDRADDGERLHLQRLLKAMPILRKLAELRAQFSAFDDVARFTEDWSRKLENLLAERDAARKAHADAAQAREAVAEEVEQAAYDAKILAQAEKIEALNRDAGAHEKALDDLPRREKALREITDTLRLKALACGLSDGEALRAASPDPALLPRAEKLVARGREIFAQKVEPQAALEREKRALAELSARQGAALPDRSALAEKLAAFGAVEKEDDLRADLALSCAEEARRLDDSCGRLTPPLPDLDLFARAPSPDAGAIELAAQAFDALAAREAEAGRKAAEGKEKRAGAETRLCALQKSGVIVSRDDLRTFRTQRDADWAGLDALRGDDATWRAGAEKFLAAQQQADATADALLADAARVIEAEAERENIAAAEALIADAERLNEAALEAREKLGSQWRRDWAACGVTPAMPRAMAAWRESAANLLAARENLKSKQARLAAAGEGLQKILPSLQTLAAEAGLAPLPLEAGALARRIAGRIKELASAENEAREISMQIAAAPARIKAAENRLAELAELEAAWRRDYSAALAQLRLDADATFDEAQARIALWRELPRDLLEEAGESHRVRSISDDFSAFEQRLDKLLGDCAGDIASRPALDAAKTLHQRLATERARQTTSANAEKRLAKAAAEADRAAHSLSQAESALAAFSEEEGVSGDPSEHCQRLRRRFEQGSFIGSEKERLALVAEGADEDRLAEQARIFDWDAARLRLAEIDRMAEARKLQAQEVFAGRRDAENELARLGEGFGAEQAIFAQESARVDIGGEARRWAVLKLASLMVGAGLEKHRHARQDPLLLRAGAIYKGLTSGRSIGLRQDFDEDEKPHLLACRADGPALPLAALSEGARDQLYLALRLAFLEDYAGRSEAPPFIGDDLFASFDDERLASGLAALAGASDAIQPIVFTHHAHIIEIARTKLGSKVQILQLST